MAPFQSFTAKLVQSKPLSELTRHLEFEMPHFRFVAGQWLSMKAQMPDGEEITRAYSIASPPLEGNRFALCLNRVQDGWMSNHLCDMKQGQEISCQGPFGDFILRPPMRDTLFIATGTGIAPIRSMLHWLFESDEAGAPTARHEGHQLWLIFGNRTETTLYYDDEFKRFAAEQSNFHYLPTLSRGEASWNGLRGYVQDHVAAIAKGRKDMHAYICGLDKMVKSNRELLKSIGWDRKSILFEKYD